MYAHRHTRTHVRSYVCMYVFVTLRRIVQTAMTVWQKHDKAIVSSKYHLSTQLTLTGKGILLSSS